MDKFNFSRQVYRRHILFASFTALVFALFASPDVEAAIPLARDGQPLAEIVIDADAEPAVRYAAEELQLHVKLISGAELPVVQDPADAEYQVYLKVNPGEYAEDVRAIGDTDGYAVRSQGRSVTVLGTVPKGVLNGVYKLLTRNSDIIWARPNPEFGTIYSENPNLTLQECDWRDIPVYERRGWQMIGPDKGYVSNIWSFRQGTNRAAAPVGTRRDLADKFGLFTSYASSHNLTGLYITGDKYFDEHPEYFPFFKRERQDPRNIRHRTQLCFSNEDMTEVFIKKIYAMVEANSDYADFGVLIEDVWQCCECRECSQPLKLENGEIVHFEDKEFRSTQFFIWINKIARHFQKHFPDKGLRSFAYFFTEIPPRVGVEPNISISLCPITKNSKRILNTVENQKTHSLFLEWAEKSKGINWREYYGLCGPFPRPIDEIAMQDWSYVHSFGVTRTFSEMYCDSVGRRMDGISSWNVNAPYFWVLANACWNPHQDVTELRNEFFTRVYGPAASDVQEFYRIIADQFFVSPGKSRWNDQASGNWRMAVVEPGLTEQCRAALDHAAEHELTEKGRKMLDALRTTFEEQVALAVPIEAIQAAKVTGQPPEFDPFFRSGDWAKTECVDKFSYLRSDTPAPRRSEVRLLYDDQHLYVGLNNSYPNAESMIFDREFKDKIPFPEEGEAFELFFADGKSLSEYFQFVITPAGNRFSADGETWNWDVQTDRRSDGWSALVTIPWQTLGYDPKKTRRFYGTFIRLSKAPGEKLRFASMYNSLGHSITTFCPISLAH